MMIFDRIFGNKRKYAFLSEAERASDKGTEGEDRAAAAVCEMFRRSSSEGDLYRNVLVPAGSTFSEIDLVSVSTFGIQVYEVKNRDGHFTGEFIGRTWKQSTVSGTYDVRNPYLQNEVHIRNLVRYLEGETGISAERLNREITNVVLFTGNASWELSGRLPERPFFFGSAGDYRDTDFRETELSDSELGSVSEALGQISGFSESERMLLIERRKKNV